MCSTKGAGPLKAIENRYFGKVLLMNSIRTYKNLLKKFISAHFLLLENFEQGALRKELIIATFVG